MRSVGKPHHQFGHGLKELEKFINTALKDLPPLEKAKRDIDIFRLCTYYQSTCSSIFKELLGHVEKHSVVLSRFLAQTWEISSSSYLVLLKVCQGHVNERAQIKSEVRDIQEFHNSVELRNNSQFDQMQSTIEKLRNEKFEIQAELNKIRRRSERMSDENDNLRRILEKCIHYSKVESASYSSDDNVEDEEDDLFYFEKDELKGMQEVDPLESVSGDIDKILAGLISSNKESVDTLHDIDRFIESNLVSVLWRHQPGSDQFLNRLINTKSQSCQTDVHFDQLIVRNITTGEEDIPKQSRTKNNAKKNAKREKESLSTSIRSQLSTCPKLWLESLNYDSANIKGNLPRLSHLNEFIKNYFVKKFGMKSLADFHIVELLKSCMYYRKKLEDGTDLLTKDATGANLYWEDARILIFGRLCEIFVEEELSHNTAAGFFPIFLDMLGDLIELDPGIQSFDQFLQQDKNGQAEVNREVCVLVLSSHLHFIGSDKVDALNRKIRKTSSNSKSKSKIELDTAMCVFMGGWCDYDREFENRLHLAFHSELSNKCDDLLTLGMEEFISAVKIVDDDDECTKEELKSLFLQYTTEKKQGLKKVPKGRRKSGKADTKALLRHEGFQALRTGVNEDLFTELIGNLFRSKRPIQGIRTNKKPLLDRVTGYYYGGMGRIYRKDSKMELKPSVLDLM